jgi:hypothetical protein
MVSEIETEPQRFALTEVKPSPAPTRSVKAERRYLGGVLHLLLVGLVAAAIIGAFFASAFSLLAPPRDKAVLGAGYPAPDQAVNTVKVTTSRGDPIEGTDASASATAAPEPRFDALEAPASLSEANSTPAAAQFTHLAGGPPQSPSKTGRTKAQPGSRSGRSGHHSQRPAAHREKQRTLSAAMQRAHRQNFSDAPATLTPPPAWTTNPFDQHAAHPKRTTKTVESLTPP